MNNPTAFCFILNCHKGDTILILFLDRMVGKCNNFLMITGIILCIKTILAQIIVTRKYHIVPCLVHIFNSKNILDQQNIYKTSACKKHTILRAIYTTILKYM